MKRRGCRRRKSSQPARTRGPSRHRGFDMSMDIGGAKGGVKADISGVTHWWTSCWCCSSSGMMLMARCCRRGVDVRLPSAANTTDKPETSDQTRDRHRCRQARLRELRAGPPGGADGESDRLVRGRSRKIIIIKADEDLDYSTVMDTMDLLSKGRRGRHGPHR